MGTENFVLEMILKDFLYGDNMDGIIVVDKPKNCTSHDIVNKVRKILETRKIGHTGTLDPNATGVLPLLIGDATKISKYLINHDKEYEVILKLGIKTDTADVEGNIIEKQKIDIRNFQKDYINMVLQSFKGKQMQVPPIYSAIKVNGKKLYEYARKGESIKIEPREIEIYDIQLKNINDEENEVGFLVSCSKGTYIRSLCEDIAKKLETIGYMKELKRTKVGKFNIKEAITLDELSNKEIVKEKIITIQQFFKDKENIKLSQKKLEKLLNGINLDFPNYINGIYNIYDESGKYVGIGTINDNKLKRDIILTHNL